MLGHSTITLTLDTYSHVVPGLHAQAAKEMQRLFDGGTRERERYIVLTVRQPITLAMRTGFEPAALGPLLAKGNY